MRLAKPTSILVASLMVLLVINIFQPALAFVPGVSLTYTAKIESSADQGIPRGTVDPNYTVQTWVPSKTWNGTTLFANDNTGELVEVNMLGELVWRYKIPQHSPKAPFITGVMIVPGSDNVLFTLGGGLKAESLRGCYEVNRQDQIVWQFVDKRVSHDCVRLPNGNTLIAAAHSEDYSPWPYTDPQVFEVNPQGQIVWEWHAKDVYSNDPKYKDVRGTDFGPWTHVNEALRLPDGSTLISPRNFNMTIFVDQAGNLAKSLGDPCISGCGAKGRIDYPHPPIPLPKGNVLISEPVVGRAIEFDPDTKRVVWQWPQGGSRGSEWLFVRAAQRLPNGNTLVVDSNGQLLEVTTEGEVVWKLRTGSYGTGVDAAPFFAAERLSYMPPSFTINSPVNDSYYQTSQVPLSVSEGLDVGKITYSLLDNTNNTWMVRNATLLENMYKDFLSPPTKVKGPQFLDLPNGDYTLRIFASSTGFGYKAFVDPKRINYAVQGIVFFVNKPVQQTFRVQVGNSTFAVGILSNSTVSQFEFSQSSKQIRFLASGKSGTAGFSEAAVPVELLGGKFTVLVNGTNQQFSQSSNPTHNLIRVNYSHSSKLITITGTFVVPEFPLTPVIALAIAITATLIIVEIKRAALRKPMNSLNH